MKNRYQCPERESGAEASQENKFGWPRPLGGMCRKIERKPQEEQAEHWNLYVQPEYGARWQADDDHQHELK